MVRHYQIRGRVQGVGFRWFVHREASAIGLRGWVRNTEEGDVEVVASGSVDQLQALRVALHRGPRGSRVDAVAEDNLPDSADEELRPFRIDGAW